MVITPGFQPGDDGSIPFTRSKLHIAKQHPRAGAFLLCALPYLCKEVLESEDGVGAVRCDDAFSFRLGEKLFDAGAGRHGITCDLHLTKCVALLAGQWSGSAHGTTRERLQCGFVGEQRMRKRLALLDLTIDVRIGFRGWQEEDFSRPFMRVRFLSHPIDE